MPTTPWRLHRTTEVRKTPSWRRSWAKFSRLSPSSYRNAWASLRHLGRPNTFLAGGPRALLALLRRALRGGAVRGARHRCGCANIVATIAHRPAAADTTTQQDGIVAARVAARLPSQCPARRARGVRGAGGSGDHGQRVPRAEDCRRGALGGEALRAPSEKGVRLPRKFPVGPACVPLIHFIISSTACTTL